MYQVNNDPKLGFKLPNGIKLIHGDCRTAKELLDLPDESVHIIFTDPPYREEDLDLLVDLRKIALSKLVQGGSLFLLYGTPFIFEAGDRLRPHLKYVHQFIMPHTSSIARLHDYGIWPYYKPVLWFIKGEKLRYRQKDIGDILKSEKPDKSTFEWTQSPIEANDIIKNYTVEGEIVLDPFMGEGTFGQAAIKLGRKFIGVENDKQRYDTAKHKLLNSLDVCENKNKNKNKEGGDCR